MRLKSSKDITIIRDMIIKFKIHCCIYIQIQIFPKCKISIRELLISVSHLSLIGFEDTFFKNKDMNSFAKTIIILILLLVIIIALRLPFIINCIIGFIFGFYRDEIINFIFPPKK